MSLRVVPTKATPSSTSQSYGAPSAPGIHDTLRSNLSLTTPISAHADTAAPEQIISSHPLEARLTRWRATQDSLKMEGLRRMYGIAEPIRRGMELRIAGMGEWRPSALGMSACVHSDILNGRDAEVGWEDVFVGGEMRDLPDFHSEMENKMRMHW